MECTRIYTDSMGDSHFENDPINMEEKDTFGYFSDPVSNVNHMYFQNTMPHHEWDFQSVRDTIYLVIISEELGFETSDGSKKIFKAGEIVLLDDHSGKGHKVKTFDNTVSLLVVHCD